MCDGLKGALALDEKLMEVADICESLETGRVRVPSLKDPADEHFSVGRVSEYERYAMGPMSVEIEHLRMLLDKVVIFDTSFLHGFGDVGMGEICTGIEHSNLDSR